MTDDMWDDLDQKERASTKVHPCPKCGSEMVSVAYFDESGNEKRKPMCEYCGHEEKVVK